MAETAQQRVRDPVSSDHPLARALDGLDVGVAVFDAAGRLAGCNRRYHALFPGTDVLEAAGAHYRDLLAQHAATVLDPGESPRVQQMAQRERPADRPLPSPQLLQRRDGGWLELEERVGGDGDLICQWTDVTRRLDAETEVVRLQARLRDAIQSLPDGIALFDADDRLDLHNSAFAERYGLDPHDSLVGRRFEDLLRLMIEAGVHGPVGADAAARDRWIAAAVARHRAPAGPIEIRLSDGRWIRVSETRTHDGGIVGVHADVTELKRREMELGRLNAELSRSEARKQAIFETALDGVVTIDAEGLIVEFNPAAERTLGWTRAEALGRRMDDLVIPPAYRERHRAGFRRYLEGGGGAMMGRRLELSAMRRDGSEFPAELAITATRVGEDLFFTAYLRDITDRKVAEQALIDSKAKAEAAAQAKANFLNNMSHELRTPLNAIIGFSEIIKEQVLGPIGVAKYTEFASDIYESGAHLLAIINDVLDMSRIEAGQHLLQLEPLDLAPVVRSCLQMVRGRAASGGVGLVDDTGPLPVVLVADRKAVMKILLNLLSNAVKFTPPGGTARVAAAGEGDGTVVLTVADTGIGIAPEAMDRVFDPFQQGDMGLNRQHEGVGLGLAITRTLVLLHGGAITLDSAPGQGTTATVRFPPAPM